MAEYTYKDVIIDPEDPRVEIGAEYYWGDTPRCALDSANNKGAALRLFSVDMYGTRTAPFFLNGSISGYAVCIIRKKEPEKRYVPFDLSLPEDREKLRGAWIRYKDSEIAYCIFAISPDEAEPCVTIWGEEIPVGLLLEKYTFLDGTPCGKLVEVE